MYGRLGVRSNISDLFRGLLEGGAAGYFHLKEKGEPEWLPLGKARMLWSIRRGLDDPLQNRNTPLSSTKRGEPPAPRNAPRMLVGGETVLITEPNCDGLDMLSTGLSKFG